MTKKDLFYKTLNGEKTVRPPVSAWRHFIDAEHSGPEDFSEAMIAFQEKWDWDFVKLQPRAVFYEEAWGAEFDFREYNGLFVKKIKNVVNGSADLDKISELSGVDGVFKEQIDCLPILRDRLGWDIPIIHTVFTPIGVLSGLCADPYLGRYREAKREESLLIQLIHSHPEKVHKALKAIAQTLARYCKKAVQSGADGMFYGALGMARSGYLTKQEWQTFVKPYDLIVLESIKDAVSLLHTCGIHGNPQWFADYPITALHWAETADGNPKLKGSEKWLKGKIAMGGLDERFFGENQAECIYKKTLETRMKMKTQPFLLTPDCSLAFNTLDKELEAFKKAATEVL